MRVDLRALDRSSLGWALVTAGGLMLAVAGLTTSPATRDTARQGARLWLRIPDAAGIAVVGLFALAAILLLALLWPRELWRRRRKKGDDEFELYHEPPKVPPWVAPVLLVLILLPFAAVGWLLWQGWSTPMHEARPLPPGATLPPLDRPAPDVAGPPSISMPAFDVVIIVLAVCAGLVAIGLLLWLHLGDRLARWWVGRLFDDLASPLRNAITESLDDLRREPDARVAIIKCYRRLEQVLAACRAPRAPWQTPAEFMRVTLERLPLPREPLALLTGLFELSRFSDRRLGPTERDAACDCLAEIKRALGPRDEADLAA